MKLKFVSGSVSSCNICDKTFFDGNDLYWHIRKQHLGLGWPAMPFKCDLCGAAYIKKIELKGHTKKHHSSNPKPPVEESDDKHEEEVGDTEVKDDKASQLEEKESVEITELPREHTHLIPKCESDSDIPDLKVDREDDTEVQDNKANQVEEKEPV